MLLILAGIGLIIFGLFYLGDSGFFSKGRMKWYEAVLIDEVEDEVYDNIGGTKMRFFKAFEFEDEGEKKVVRSQRPLRHITGKTGKKTKILVNVKTRKAMERNDVVIYRIIATLLILAGISLFMVVWYVRANVKGSVF